MAERRPLGWEHRLGWGLRAQCRVAAAACGGTVPMPPSPSTAGLTQVFFVQQC